MFLKFVLFCTVLCKTQTASEDLCEYACFEEPGYLYDFGCPYSSKPDSTCLCGTDAFISTVVNCIERLTTNTSANLNTSLTALAKACKMTLDELTPYVSNSSSLLYYSGSYTEKPGKWPVTEAFALQDKEIWDAYQVTVKSENIENFNKRYGVALVAYWAGLAVIDSAAHFAKWLLPLQWMKLRRLTRHIPPIPAWAHIAVFLIFSAVFAFIQLGNHSPNYLYRYSFGGAFGTYLGKRTGVMALYLLPLVVLFAGRNNFLLWMTNWPQSRYLLYHRWIARVTVAFMLAHAIAYSIARSSTGLYASMWSKTYWKVGIVALAFGIFSLIQGSRFIRRRAYDLFIITHIVVVIVILATAYWHLKDIKTSDLKFFYTCFAV